MWKKKTNSKIDEKCEQISCCYDAQMLPGVPLSPLSPGVPYNPGGPWSPLGPVDPGNPSDPFTPGYPSTPGLPDVPGSPRSPFIPWGPNVPGTPGGPWTPGSPGKPGSPARRRFSHYFYYLYTNLILYQEHAYEKREKIFKIGKKCEVMMRVFEWSWAV